MGGASVRDSRSFQGHQVKPSNVVQASGLTLLQERVRQEAERDPKFAYELKNKNPSYYNFLMSRGQTVGSATQVEPTPEQIQKLKQSLAD